MKPRPNLLLKPKWVRFRQDKECFYPFSPIPETKSLDVSYLTSPLFPEVCGVLLTSDDD